MENMIAISLNIDVKKKKVMTLVMRKPRKSDAAVLR
jgi:hypothetical protein